MKFDILKVKDKTDKDHIAKKRIFDIPFKIAIVGKSQHSLGKTTIILNLIARNIFYNKDFKGENIFIVSNNELDNKIKILMKQKEIPDENRMEYDEDLLDALYDQIQEEYQEEKKNTLILFDDCAYSADLKNREAGVLSKIVMNGRHAGISSIFTSQKYSLLGVNIRTQLTGLFIGKLANKELELVEPDFNFSKLNKREFFNMIKDNTPLKRDFVIFNESNDPEEKILNKHFEPINPDNYLKKKNK